MNRLPIHPHKATEIKTSAAKPPPVKSIAKLLNPRVRGNSLSINNSANIMTTEKS